MNASAHCRELGKLLGNLQALEASLRLYLYFAEDPPHEPLPSGLTFPAVVVGQALPVNALTDYSSLEQLITRFNRRVAASHPQLALDPSLVALRDALVHGRVLALPGTSQQRLFKFGKPANGTAVATFAVDLNEVWLREQAGRVRAAVASVAKAASPRFVAPLGAA